MKTREWQFALLRPRPLAGQPQAHGEPRPPLRILSADQPRRPRHRALGPRHQHRLLRRPGRHAAECRHHRQPQELSPRASAWPTASARKTVFRAGYGLTWDPLPFGRPLRGLYPSTLTGSWVPTVSTFGWFNTHQRRHSGYRHPRCQQGPGDPADQYRHGSAQPLGRPDSSRLHPELERHARTAAARSA